MFNAIILILLILLGILHDIIHDNNLNKNSTDKSENKDCSNYENLIFYAVIIVAVIFFIHICLEGRGE